MTIDDPVKLIRSMTADLREMTRAAQRRAAKIRAELFQKRECGLLPPLESDGENGDA